MAKVKKSPKQERQVFIPHQRTLTAEGWKRRLVNAKQAMTKRKT